MAKFSDRHTQLKAEDFLAKAKQALASNTARWVNGASYFIRNGENVDVLYEWRGWLYKYVHVVLFSLANGEILAYVRGSDECFSLTDRRELRAAVSSINSWIWLLD